MGLFNRRKAAKATVPEWANFFASPEQVERFVAALRTDFERRGVEFVIHDGWVFLGNPADDKSPRMGLTNIGQRCAKAPEREWPAMIQEHFNNTMAALRGEFEPLPKTYAEAAPRLAVRIYENAETDAFRGQFATRVDFDGLTTVLAFDGTRTISMIHSDTLKEWGVDDDTAFARAINNLPVLAPVETSEVSADQLPGVVLIIGESMHVASRILEPDDVLPPDEGMGVMFSAPTRHTILAYPIRAATFPDGLRGMIFLTHKSFADGPGSITGRLFWRYQGQTHQLPYEVTPQGVRFDPPESFNTVMAKGLGEGPDGA